MASSVRVYFRLPIQWSSRNYATQQKFYKVKPKYYKDVAQKYARFRREVSVLRKQFLDEWTEQHRMTQTEFSTKAAEEARLKEAEEAQAFEIASRELERMAKERAAADQRKQEDLRTKREKGDAIRLQREEESLEWLTKKTEIVEEARSDIITVDNVDEKIAAALEHEVIEDFVITPTTGEITSITYKDIK